MCQTARKNVFPPWSVKEEQVISPANGLIATHSASYDYQVYTCTCAKKCHVIFVLIQIIVSKGFHDKKPLYYLQPICPSLPNAAWYCTNYSVGMWRLVKQTYHLYRLNLYYRINKANQKNNNNKTANMLSTVLMKAQNHKWWTDACVLCSKRMSGRHYALRVKEERAHPDCCERKVQEAASVML